VEGEEGGGEVVKNADSKDCMYFLCCCLGLILTSCVAGHEPSPGVIIGFAPVHQSASYSSCFTYDETSDKSILSSGRIWKSLHSVLRAVGQMW